MSADLIKIQRQLSSLLKPLGVIYALIMHLRVWFWKKVRSGYRSNTICVSVGNIAWGGTGKTPLVDWLLSWSETSGVSSVVLTRGYKANLKFLPTKVNGKHTAREVGDEPLMLFLSHPHSTIIVDPNRSRSAQYVDKAIKPNLLILDDGFQHLAMQRDLDLVLLRPEDLKTDWNKVIPAGPWRENKQALHRAGAFLIKCTPDQMHSLLPALNQRLAEYAKPLFSFYLAPTRLRRIGSDTACYPQECQGKPYILLTGVGQPTQVLTTVSTFMEHEPVQHITYPDHHRYSFNEIEKIAKRNIMVISTAKDAVKLRHLPAPNFWYLQTELRFGPSLWAESNFEEWWKNWYENNKKKSDEIILNLHK